MLFFRKYLPSFVLIIKIMFSGLAAITGPVLGGLFSLLLLCYSGVSSASSLGTWDPVNIAGQQKYSSHYAACGAYRTTSPGDSWVYGYKSVDRYSCTYKTISGSTFLWGDVLRTYEDCPFGDNGSSCNTSCDSPNVMVDGQCIAPPSCPEGSNWDFDSESCKYPQDDACSSIGASWDPAASACQCDSPTAALVTAAGVTRCMQLRDDSCDSNSPDFKGYGPSGQAICDGRASCPDGGTPGYVGSGDTLSAICYSNPAEPNENCDGQFGVQDGVQVCIPNVGADDPDFPDCDGVVGTFNGVKRCIDKPGGHAGCSAGETPGYAGAGDNATFTCIPSDYKPDSCPPGQYVTNAATGGFGCATTSPTPPKDPNAPPTTGGTSTSTTTNKDADGNVIGTSETETKLPDGAMEITFPDLLQDQPQNNYFTETDEFGDSQLEKLDADTASILSEFTGADGAFTQRNSLESASDRLLGLFGYSTSCSGDLIFYQSENRTIKASCEKLNKMRELLGWFLYVSTLMGIYNILMQKQEN